MSPNIPIPTDNVHKFYAGFGLVVFIASLIAIVYVQNNANDRILQWFEESTKIEKLEKQTEADKDQLKRIEDIIEVTKLDKKTLMYFLLSSSLFGLFVAGWGFQAWEKKLQPKLDEKLNLELELLREEIKTKKSSNNQHQRTRFARR